jgi:hypothetical protein
MHRFWMSFYQTHKCGSVSFTLMIFILVRMEPFCRGVSCIGHSSGGPDFLAGGNEGDDAVTIDQLCRDASLI